MKIKLISKTLLSMVLVFMLAFGPALPAFADVITMEQTGGGQAFPNINLPDDTDFPDSLEPQGQSGITTIINGDSQITIPLLGEPDVVKIYNASATLDGIPLLNTMITFSDSGVTGATFTNAFPGYPLNPNYELTVTSSSLPGIVTLTSDEAQKTVTLVAQETVELVPTSITLSGASSIDVPQIGLAAEIETYSAVVKDQFGNPMTVSPTITAIDHELLMVEFENAEATVNQTSLAGSFTVTAEYQDFMESMVVTVNKEDPVASSLGIQGPSSLAVPYVGDPHVLATYQAVVYDQYGAPMPGLEPTIAVSDKPARVTFDHDTLKVKQNSAGGPFQLLATYNGLTDAVLNGTILREDPKVYEMTLTGPDTIAVPLYGSLDQVVNYSVAATNQYGGNININWRLEGATIPIDVVLNNKSIAVSYDDAAGNMALWAVLRGNKEWHENVALGLRKSNTLDVAVTKEAPVATWLELDGPLSYNVPYYDQAPVTGLYVPTVFDQYGYEMDVPVVLTATDHTGIDVMFDVDTATIDQNSQAGTFRVTASYGDLTDVFIDAVVNREAPEPSRLEIFGEDEVHVPYVGLPAIEEAYSASVFDQYGWVMPDEEVTLGITYKPDTAAYIDNTLIVNQATMAGAFKVVATHALLGDKNIMGMIYRESPMVYEITLTGPSQIAVPYFEVADQEALYSAFVTDQYGYTMFDVATILVQNNAPADVDLDDMSIVVSYDDDAGTMTVWAVLNEVLPLAGLGENEWHETITPENQKSNVVTVEITKETPYAARIILSGETDLDVPYEGDESVETYTAIVYDQYGDVLEVDAEIILANGSVLPDAIDLDDGDLTLVPSDQAGSFDLVAVYNELESNVLSITVDKEVPYGARVELTGATDIDVPVNNIDVVETYTLTVYDQYGAVITGLDEIILTSLVDGVTFDQETRTLTVTNEAPHGYVKLFALFMNPVEILGLEDQEEGELTIYLHKSVQVLADDVNNIILGANDLMEYRIVLDLVPSDYALTRWMMIDEEFPTEFPGNTRVQVRYRGSMDLPYGQIEPHIISERPLMFEPGEAVTLNFTVLAPTISSPGSAFPSATVSLINNEDPTNTDPWISTQMFYRFNTSDAWSLYTGPFVISQTTTVYAKTIVIIDPLEDDSFGQYYLSGTYESDVVQKTTVISAPPVTTGGETPTPEVVIEDLTTPLGAIDFYEPYTRGYTDGSFRPKQAVTRAEFAAMLARLLKLDTSSVLTGFSDVPSSHWSAKYVAAVKKIGLVSGFSNGTFKPNSYLSKAEMAAILSNYWAFTNQDVSNAQAPYDDIAGNWAQLAINQIYNSGIMEGFTDNMYKPTSAIARDEVVVMLNRLTNRPTLASDTPFFSDVLNPYWSYGHIESATRYFSGAQPVQE